MATPHNNAEKGQFAKTVLMPGDPLRAKWITETFMEDVQLVTSVRNVYGYTGTYKGKPVSVMASGMGMPSIGIYSYELYNFYDVENIIRVGSAGAYSAGLELLDVVLAENAWSESSFARVQGLDESDLQYPSKELNDVIINTAKETGSHITVGTIHSSDVFYRQPEASAPLQDTIKEKNLLCVEMESFALFHNANVLGKRAACLLSISDSFVSGKEIDADSRATAFKAMMELALESAIRL